MKQHFKFLITILEVNVSKPCIDTLHRLSSAEKPLHCEICEVHAKNLAFLNKKLKDSGIVITEALSPQRRACVKRLT